METELVSYFENKLEGEWEYKNTQNNHFISRICFWGGSYSVLQNKKGILQYTSIIGQYTRESCTQIRPDIPGAASMVSELI